MKVIIHATQKRAWGYETSYTLFDDDGQEYNGFLPQKTIIEKEVIDSVNAFKARQEQKLEDTPAEMTETTSADRELIDIKTKVKAIVIDEIKAKPTIKVSELESVVTAKAGVISGKLTEGLIDIYVSEAWDRNMIEQKTFEALKSFVADTSKEQIEAIR